MVNVANGCCSLDALCAMHADDSFAQLRGVAQARGWQWAGELLARGVTPETHGPWPDASDRLITVALIKVADLARDAGLRRRLADEAIRAARRRWLEASAAPAINVDRVRL